MIIIVMPVGRYREDPRELGEREREIHARQYPEGLLVVGTMLGIALKFGFQFGLLPATSAVVSNAIVVTGVVVGGVGGYLVGIRYRRRKIRAIDDEDRDAAAISDRADRSDADGSDADDNDASDRDDASDTDDTSERAESVAADGDGEGRGD